MFLETRQAARRAQGWFRIFAHLFRRAGRNAFLLVLAAASPQVAAQAKSPAELFQEADAAFKQGDAQRAIHLYEELLKLQPYSVEARTNLGAAFAHVGRYDDAVIQYKEALKHDSENPAIMINLALAWYKEAAFDKAAVELEYLRAKHTENRQALYLLADCYLRLGRNRDAVALLQPVYDADPEDRVVNFTLGMALLRDGPAQKGQAIVDRVLKDGNPGEMDLLLGAAQFAAGEAKIAAPTIRKALDADPNLPGAWALYGRALLESGDPDGAKEAFQKALQADPNDFDANLYLGEMLRHEGSLSEAAPYLQKALLLRRASVEARLQVGMLSLADGHLEDARKNLEQVVHDSPDFQEAHAQLAVLYARLHRDSDSKRERRIVLQLNEKARAEAPKK